MVITITAVWWLIPMANTVAGFCWALQPKFHDYQPGGMFSLPPTWFFALIPATMWALINWLIYFIIF